MSINFDGHGYQKIDADGYFNFDCLKCGDCCRNVKDSVMAEPLDLYRLARFLKMDMGDVILKYTDTVFLAWAFPVFMLKTKHHMDACIFLKDSRCGIHGAKPRACRTYPLGVGPGDKPGAWLNFIVSKKTHKFAGRQRRVRDWLNENLKPEDYAFVAADYNHTGELARLIKKADRRHEDHIIQLILFFRYFAYDTEEDFMPQYTGNMEQLKKQLEYLSKNQ